MDGEVFWLASLRNRKGAVAHLEMLLTRKQRRAGIGRCLLRQASRTAKPVEYRRGPIRALIKQVEISGVFLYDIVCVEGRAEAAKLVTSRVREIDREKKVPLGERSKLRWLIPKQAPARAAVQVARLKRHLRHTWLSWDFVVRAMAEALRTNVRTIENRLLPRLTDNLTRGERAVSLVHHTEFRFHLELVGDGRPSENPNIEVFVYTTNNNKDPAYRRFRRRLKKLCGLEKSDREAKVVRLARRSWRKEQQLKYAA